MDVERVRSFVDAMMDVCGNGVETGSPLSQTLALFTQSTKAALTRQPLQCDSFIMDVWLRFVYSLSKGWNSFRHRDWSAGRSTYLDT